MEPTANLTPRDLAEHARRLLPHERLEFLERACGSDTDLRRRVEAILALDETRQGRRHRGGPAGGVPPRGAPVSPGTAPGPSRPPLRPAERAAVGTEGVATATTAPETIGPFKVVRPIGAGGMGVVYECEQDFPRRLVAVKVLHAAIITPEALGRFEREAEILGRLQHPGIAQVLEAGFALAGPGRAPRPYVAMELVHGRTLVDHANATHLGHRERLELLARVCDAVQHAHERGIVHRDLKPANIVVEASGQPKVLDFGVARVVGSDTLATLHTVTGQLLGTVAYMSPEQVAGDPDLVGVRSDVHALGVIAFELMTGRLPHDLEGVPLAEALRRIQEVEAPRMGSLDRTLRGDVETIVGKALERDPDRRYASAAELAADIRRHLRDEPIVARPPSAAYQLMRLARRHRAVALGAAIALVALVAGFAVAVREAAQERRASAEARAKEEIATRQAYRAGLAAASASLREGDPALARAHLDGVPAELRGWEWRHLVAQLDESDATLTPEPARGVAFDSASGTWTVEGHGPGAALVHREPGGAELARHLLAEEVRLDVREAAEATRALRQIALAGPLRVSWEGGAITIAPRPADAFVKLLDVAPAGDRWAVARVAADGTGTTTVETAWADAWSLPAALGTPYVARFSDDGSVIAVSQGAQWVEVREAATGTLRTVVSIDRDDVRSADMAGDILYVGSLNSWIRAFDVRTGDALARVRLPAVADVMTIDATPDAVVAGTTRGTLHVLDPDLRRERQRRVGHRAAILAVDVSDDGAAIATAGDGVKLWMADAPSRGRLRGHESYVYAVDFVGPRRLVTGGWDATVRLWDVATEQPLASLRVPGGGFGDATVVALARVPPASVLVSDWSGRLEVRDLVTGRATASALMAPPPSPGQVAVAPDAGRVAVHVDLREAGDELRVLDGALAPVCSRAGLTGRSAFDATGARLASGTLGGGLVVLDPLTCATVVASSDRASGAPFAVTWSPDGRTVYGSHEDGAARRWDAATGALVAENVMPGRAFDVAVAPDGTRVAIACIDGVVRILDAATLEVLLELRGHDAYAYALAWSADGAILASTSGDHDVRLWSVEPRSVRSAARARRAAALPLAEPLARELMRHPEPAAALEALGVGEDVARAASDLVTSQLWQRESAPLPARPASPSPRP